MKGKDRHSFNRKLRGNPEHYVEQYHHCLRCRLARKATDKGWLYLDRQGWTDKAPPCLQVRAENEQKERRLLEKVKLLMRDPLDKFPPLS